MAISINNIIVEGFNFPAGERQVRLNNHHIDDICDGGQTFISLAQSLKKQGAAEIFLYVTHGIFSKGLDQLKTCIQHIYCYHLVGHHLDSHHPSFITILKGEAS